MKKWLSVLAVVFMLGSGAVLTACGPPEDIDDEELDEAMDEAQDESMDDAMEDDSGSDMNTEGGEEDVDGDL